MNTLSTIATEIALELRDAGEGFRIQRNSDGHVDVWLYHYGSELAHAQISDESGRLDELLDFVVSVAYTITADEKVGLTNANFAARRIELPDLRLAVEFELIVDDCNDWVSASLELWGKNCDHVLARGTASLNLRQLVENVSHVYPGLLLS